MCIAMARFTPTGLRQRVLCCYGSLVGLSAAVAFALWPSHWRAILSVLAGATLAGWSARCLATRHLRDSLGKLRQTTDALSRGDLRRPIDDTARQDFVKLAGSLDRLIDHLHQLVEEREQLRRQLTRSEKLALIGELTAALAHEINNPLDGLQNCTRIIRRDPTNIEQTRKLLDLMEEGLYRIEMSLRRMMSMARDAPVTLIDIQIEDVIRDALLVVQPRLDRNQIVLVHESPDPHLRVLADRAQLTQALINLLINAADAMPGGGRITLRHGTCGEGSHVDLEIIDTGQGIPPDVLPHIFEPFYTTKDGGSGTGLGLAITARIIEAHGGTIGVASQPGRGTCFTLTLQAAGQPPATQVAVPVTTDATNGNLGSD